MVTMSLEEISELKVQMSEINKNVNSILFYLHNDPNTGKVGLVQQVKNNENQIEELNEKHDKMLLERTVDKAVRKSTMAIFGTIGGLVGGAIIWLAKIITTYVLAKM